MFKLAQKKKEEQEKKEQQPPGFAKQMSIRSKLLTQGMSFQSNVYFRAL